MTLSDAAWQKQGEDHPVLFAREIVTYKEKAESRISGSWQEGGAGRKKGKMWFAFAVLMRISGVMLCKGNTAGSLIIITRTNSPC